MQPDDYLDFVHKIDHSPLEPNPALGAALEKLAGPQAHPHQRHAQARRRGDEAAGDPPSFRGCVRYCRRRSRSQAAAAGLQSFSCAPRRRSGEGGDVRGPGAQSRNAARARHDHGAGGAGSKFWSSKQVWAYIRDNDVPYNALHDRGFISIGCEPCTRPTNPGQHERAGAGGGKRKRRRNAGSTPETSLRGESQLVI